MDEAQERAPRHTAEAHTQDLARLGDLVRSAPEILTEREAVELFLDNSLSLLPCDVAGVILLSDDGADGKFMSRVDPAEVLLPSFTELLRQDLSVFVRDETQAPETEVIPGPPTRETLEGEPELRSFLSMPVFTAGETVGILGVASQASGAFAVTEERVLSALSTHLSLALQQLYYQDSLETTIAQLEGLNNALRRLHTALDRIGAAREPQEIYELVLELTLQEMEADAGSLILVGETDEGLEVAASRGLSEEILASESYNRSSGIARWAIEHAQTLSLGPGPLETQFSSPAGDRDIASALVAPLRVHRRVIGALNVNRIRVREAFSPVQTEMMSLIASASAEAIENARLRQKQLESERVATIGMTVLGIGHYIKNLNTIIQVGQKLMDNAIRNRTWEPVEAAWGTIRRGTDRMTNLALDLLDFARPKEPKREPTDLNELARAALEEVRPSADHFLIEVRFMPADEARVPVDKSQAHRCLLNLLTNAVDAMPEGGTLTVETRVMEETKARPGRYCVITVSDTGGGIPDDILQKIYQPMFSTKGSRGTGIGLAVTRKIMEEHGGRIEVETSPGQGTSFTLHFPLGD